MLVSNPINRSNPAIARLQTRHLLTQSGSSKTTFHLSLDIRGSGLQFKVGDSLAILPRNDPLLVNHLLEAMHATGHETVIDPRSKQELSLEEFLSTKANLSRLTSSFLKLLYEYDPPHDKKNQLRHLLQQDSKPLLSQYLSTHDPLDLLKEYQEVTVPLQSLCEQFGPLLPRFYSIASSPRFQPDTVDLTVALFTFTHAGEPRFGVASHFLCRMAQAQTTPIPVYLQPTHHFTLPSDPSTPLIMIGPGTGVAPFRAFLQERIFTGASGKNWLFFGERNRTTDFFYQKDWEGFVERKQLELDLAFSRDQTEKCYVQHRMLQKSKQLWSWLQEGAYFYVCGDAHRMAKDVEATFLQIVQQEGNVSLEDAKVYLKELRLQKRYLTDVY